MSRVDLVAVMIAVTVSSCRGGSDEECTTDDHADVSGMWELTTTVTSSCDPDDVGDQDIEIIDVTQDGDRIFFELSGFFLVGEIAGTICGQSFTASARESDEFLGCAGTETVTVRGTVDGATASGTVTWSRQVVDPEACLGITSCSGTTAFEAERLP